MAQALETVTKTTSTQPVGSEGGVTTTEVTHAVTDLPAPVKPGWQTTEFWLSLAATLLSALFAAGVLTNSTALAIAGIAATILTALGYTVSRALVKK